MNDTIKLKESMARYDKDKWAQARQNRWSKIRGFVPIKCPPWITFDVEVEPDYWPDTSWLGKFTDRWEPGAIKHSDDRREYRWFVPENKEEDTFDWYHVHGYSKQVAREHAKRQVHEDYHIAKNFESYVITVKMYMHGEFVDSQSLGGVMLGSDYKMAESYKQEIARELEQDLLHQHRWKITANQYAYA